jgi:predicted rRNA methylase YqxC with S4 and FtsJ domains
MLVAENNNICKNCEKLQKTMQQIRRRYLAGINSVKAIHASKNILIEKVDKQRKIIKLQNETISNIKEKMQKKIEIEEIEVSDKIANIAHTVAKSVTSKNIDISNFHPLFQELIRIQTGKPNGTRYHPM